MRAVIAWYRVGNFIYGISLVRFTLIYSGELRSRGRPSQIWEIREALSPQLQELWRVDSVLATVMRLRYVPLEEYQYAEYHHSQDHILPEPVKFQGAIDLLEPIERLGWNFNPLVRNSLALRCGLKINFLRKEDPGKVYQGGDIDNRLKTLFDALSVPKIEQIAYPFQGEPPMFCLLEDDALISDISVETGRLLSAPNESKHFVHLTIGVDVRLVQSKMYNQAFLGG